MQQILSCHSAEHVEQENLGSVNTPIHMKPGEKPRPFHTQSIHSKKNKTKNKHKMRESNLWKVTSDLKLNNNSD